MRYPEDGGGIGSIVMLVTVGSHTRACVQHYSKFSCHSGTYFRNTHFRFCFSSVRSAMVGTTSAVSPISDRLPPPGIGQEDHAGWNTVATVTSPGFGSGQG